MSNPEHRPILPYLKPGFELVAGEAQPTQAGGETDEQNMAELVRQQTAAYNFETFMGWGVGGRPKPPELESIDAQTVISMLKELKEEQGKLSEGQQWAMEFLQGSSLSEIIARYSMDSNKSKVPRLIGTFAQRVVRDRKFPPSGSLPPPPTQSAEEITKVQDEDW